MRLQLLHEPKFERMREELMPRIDTDLGNKLTALHRFGIERKHRPALRVALFGRRKHYAPLTVAHLLSVGGERGRLKITLRQTPAGEKLHAHVGGFEISEGSCGAQPQ